MSETKRCARCEQYLPVANFTADKRMSSGLKSYCRACCGADAIERYHANLEWARKRNREYAKRVRTPEATRNRHLRHNYGLTREQYDALLTSQCGRCAGCGTDKPNGKGFHVDHDHATGVIRGILCHNCNVAIAQMHDDASRLRALADYLERTRAGSTA